MSSAQNINIYFVHKVGPFIVSHRRSPRIKNGALLQNVTIIVPPPAQKNQITYIMVPSLSSSGKKLDPTHPPGDVHMFCDFLTHPQTYLFSNFKVAKIPDKFQLKFHGTLL